MMASKPELHILHSVNSLAEAHGGPSRAIAALAEGQARAGANVGIVTRAGGAAAITPDPALVSLTSISGNIVARSRALADHIALQAPDILHDHGLWLPGNYTAASTAMRCAVPHVISPHGALAPWALGWHPQRKRLARAVFQQRLLDTAAALIAAAEPERGHIRAIARRTPIAIIPNGVDIPEAIAVKMPGQRRTLLFLSRLHPVKNLPALISAWSRVRATPRLAQWHLRIIGPDEDGHAETLRPLIAALGPESGISLEGPAADTEKAAAFAEAEAFILPSLSENFGIVVAEALAHGLPAITTTGTPWSDLPEAGAGWHCAPDADSLAATLVEALSLPPEAIAAMGARGRALVAARYGWPQIAAKSLMLYSWIKEGGRPPEFVET